MLEQGGFNPVQNVYHQQQTGQLPISSQSPSTSVQQQQLPRQPQANQNAGVGMQQQMLPGQPPQGSQGMMSQQQWPRHQVPNPQQTLQYSGIATPPGSTQASTQHSLPRQNFNQQQIPQLSGQQQQQTPGQQYQTQPLPGERVTKQPSHPSYQQYAGLTSSHQQHGSQQPQGSQSLNQPVFVGSSTSFQSQPTLTGSQTLTGPSQGQQVPSYVHPGSQGQPFLGQMPASVTCKFIIFVILFLSSSWI